MQRERERVDVCFTSPPYALGKSIALHGNKAAAARGNTYTTHEDEDTAAWMRLMDGWFAATRNFCAAWVVNVQPLAGNKRYLLEWLAKHRARLVDIVTWDKEHGPPQMAPAVLSSRYEWLVIFANEGASRAVPFASWHGTVQSVYAGPPQRDNEFSAIHAATFPVHLPGWVLGTLCDQAKTVLDPFCGTGTTLVAAEQLGRRSFNMDIDPRYVDCSVRRWQKLTGRKAMLESTMETFDEREAKCAAASATKN